MGGFLTIGYCLRATGYCFPYCFLENFVGGKALMEVHKVVIWDPPSPPLGKTLITSFETLRAKYKINI